MNPAAVRFGLRLFVTLVVALLPAVARADWPTLRGGPERSGRAASRPPPPLRLAWVRHFAGERLGTAMEPIVAGGSVFVATHNGSVYALDADNGEPRWRFRAAGAFLHSPAAAGDAVFAACADGNLYALDARTGELRWSRTVTPAGFSASPLVYDGAVFLGARDGPFVALDAATGAQRWRQAFGSPVRQTAAATGGGAGVGGRIFVTAEDMRVRALDAKSGNVLWSSDPCTGQTARDYYPVVVKAGGRTLVVVRTNPVLPFSQLLARDREVICKAAGIDSRDWKPIDAWVKSDKTLGSPELYEKEQSAIRSYLAEQPASRTFYVFDAASGALQPWAPVLWCGGCQGVPAPPVVSADGKLFTSYRTAYSNWNLGVAPLIGLGELDLASDKITPLRHRNGHQPPWNTFWGTADEAQNLDLAGDLLLIVHQSTLSGFDLKTRQLFPIRGERDSWAGFRNLPWARNEWNGPAKGGAALVGDHVYWFSGSRLLCAVGGAKGTQTDKGKDVPDVEINPAAVATQAGPARAVRSREQLQRDLEQVVGEVISADWAPLLTEPGLSGVVLSFDTGGEVFESLALAYPHLSPGLKEKVKAYLARQWEQHPPLDAGRWPKPADGRRREWFPVPGELLAHTITAPPGERPHPFANVYALWLYGQRCGEQERVARAWPQVRAAYEDFAKTGWKLDPKRPDPKRGDLNANRYLAAYIAFGDLARQANEPALARNAGAAADRIAKALAEWWKRVAADGSPRVIANINDWDRFINEGDGLFFKLAPHRHELALFHGLTPEAAARVKAQAPEAAAMVWKNFQALCPTWALVGEERQVHSGENFVDPPDFAADAFAAQARLGLPDARRLSIDADVPWGRADLYYVMKLAVAVGGGKAAD